MQPKLDRPERPLAQLFLAPATEENVHVTIDQSVGLSDAARFLSKDHLASLEQALNGRKSFHCWAMTEGSRAYFHSMKPGDIVLLTVKGTGRFEYRGTILTTLESEALGNALWPETQNKPWELIYVFDNVDRIDIKKSTLVSDLGYQPGYVVPGVIRVDPARVRRARGRGGATDEVFDL